MINYDNLSKIWSAADKVPPYSPTGSLSEIVFNVLSKNLDCISQICHEDGHEMTNREILESSIRAALNLRNLGLNQGDILGFAAGNSRHTASIVFGALMSGISLNTLDPSMGLYDIIHMFKITMPKLVVCDIVNYDNVKEALSRLDNPASVYVFDMVDTSNECQEWKSVKELLEEHPQERNFEPLQITDCEKLPAFIICSSGTTGPPKAIPISHAARAYKLLSDPIHFPTTTRFFSFSTLYWSSGISVLLLSVINNLVRVIVNQPFSAQLFLELLRKRNLGIFLCTPAQLQLLLLEKFNEEDDLHSLKTIFCTGGDIPQIIIRRIKVPVTVAYGLTETGVISLDGHLKFGTSLKIIDETGKSLGPGQQGEICIRNKFPFLGYYGNEDATNETLRDGFVHTGDIGVMDENGILQIVDRKKDIFKYNNFHVTPSDVEEMLKEIEGVGLVCVVAVPHKIYSSLPAAVIVQTTGWKLTEVEVHKFAQAKLSHFKWLRGGVYFIGEMPMTISGKIIRREVAKIALELYEKNSDIGFSYYLESPPSR